MRLVIAQAATASALPTPGGGPHGAIAAAHGTALLHMCFLLKSPGQCASIDHVA